MRTPSVKIVNRSPSAAMTMSVIRVNNQQDLRQLWTLRSGVPGRLPAPEAVLAAHLLPTKGLIQQGQKSSWSAFATSQQAFHQSLPERTWPGESVRADVQRIAAGMSATSCAGNVAGRAAGPS